MRIHLFYVHVSIFCQWAEYARPNAQLIKTITKDDYQSLLQLYLSMFPAKFKIVIALGICCHQTIQSDMRSTHFTKDKC